MASLDAETNVWSVENADGPGAGRWPAIVIDRDGQPVVAYFDARQFDLKVARRAGVGWSVETVDAVGDVGYCPALALDADGLPNVAYIDGENDSLRYSRFDGEAWFAIAVPYAQRAGCNTALALSAGGRRYLAFYDLEDESVVEAAYEDEAWYFTQMGATRPLPDGVAPLSLALGLNGRAQLTYNGPTSLRYARDDGRQWQNAVVDGPGAAHQVFVDGQGRRAHRLQLRGQRVVRHPQRGAVERPAQHAHAGAKPHAHRGASPLWRRHLPGPRRRLRARLPGRGLDLRRRGVRRGA
ncbi:MAG: hypothetical protein M5R40_02380 [Anaerolineae bacterium]|nr:hypothetical protein [Anaerolineae bacterium]